MYYAWSETPTCCYIIFSGNTYWQTYAKLKNDLTDYGRESLLSQIQILERDLNKNKSDDSKIEKLKNEIMLLQHQLKIEQKFSGDLKILNTHY